MQRDDVVTVLTRVLADKVEVAEEAYHSEAFNCSGVAGGDSPGFEGPGGGCYLPCHMLTQVQEQTAEQVAVQTAEQQGGGCACVCVCVGLKSRRLSLA